MNSLMEGRFTLTSTIENTVIVNDKVQEILDEKGISGEVQYEILTSVDEAFSNIVFHAYHSRDDGIVEILIEAGNNSFSVTFIDYAEEFVPPESSPGLGKALMNKTGNLGIGIHVMKQFMDRVLYERVGNSNHLTLVKKLK